MNVDQIRQKLVGPIAFIPTYFTQTGQQDLESVRHTVDRAIANGMKILLLTEGDSNYSLQSEDEIRVVVRTVVEQTAGRAMVIAGTALHWWRDQIIDFSRYAEDVGVDAVMVLRPAPSAGGDSGVEDLVFETYQAVTQAVSCGVVLNGNFSMPLLKRLAALPGIAAAKEDMGDTWCHDALWAIGREVPIFNGGQKWRFLYGNLWGMPAFMTLFGLWSPPVTHRFWEAVQRQDMFAAAQIVDAYDNPFFEYAIAHRRGYHAVQQAAMEIFELGPRWLRAPQASLDDEEIKLLKVVFDNMNLSD